MITEDYLVLITYTKSAASAGRKNNHDTTRVVYLRHLYFSILTLDAQIEVSHETYIQWSLAKRTAQRYPTTRPTK